jgi:NAD(P)-dependent dehydrogenase (short-subunit alcohol dehydrogenase family)
MVGTTGMTELTGRAAVVTGAASGIGLAVAEAFVAEGMRVLMTDLDDGAVASQAQRLADAGVGAGVGAGAEVRTLVVDVTDPDSVERAAEHAVESFGALHVAVNNAGIVAGGNSWELPLSEWHRVINVDLWGVIHGIHSFVPRILATGEPGYVVNTASMAAVTAIPGIGPYTASKHAVLGISDGLRGELEAIDAPIGVSVVMPGMIKTGMNPFGSVGPEQVAANVLDAMRRGRPYVFTDDHHIPEVESRLHAIIAARADVVS